MDSLRLLRAHLLIVIEYYVHPKERFANLVDVKSLLLCLAFYLFSFKIVSILVINEIVFFLKSFMDDSEKILFVE